MGSEGGFEGEVDFIGAAGDLAHGFDGGVEHNGIAGTDAEGEEVVGEFCGGIHVAFEDWPLA